MFAKKCKWQKENKSAIDRNMTQYFVLKIKNTRSKSHRWVGKNKATVSLEITVNDWFKRYRVEHLKIGISRPIILKNS